MDRTLLAEIYRGAKLIFENAEQLYNEAQLLGTNGAFARSSCLHQISLEECSKLDLLGAATVTLMMGHGVDITGVMNATKNHKVKNYNAAYFSEPTEAEVAARSRGDLDEALRVFKAGQQALHERLNSNKNASLYVDYSGGTFCSPSLVTESEAAAMRAVNAEFLKRASLHLDLIQRMNSDPETAAATAGLVGAALEQIKNAPPAEFEERLDRELKELAAQLTGNK